MNIHPELRALRGEESPQRDAQTALYSALGEWRKTPEVAKILTEISRYDQSGVIGDCPALAGLFEPRSRSARTFAARFSRVTLRSLADNQLGHVPFRHFTDGVLSTLLLARSGHVTLSLVALDGAGIAGRPDPVTADFSPSEVWECFLAGRGQAQAIERLSGDENQTRLVSRMLDLEPGTIVHRDARREALLVRKAQGCLVSLRLQRRIADAGPTREYNLTDGKLVHQAAGNPRDSRIELMMAALGRMQRADAAPVFACVAREEGSTALRWQALRECLALDTMTGFSALTAVARSHHDELAPAAGALRSQLVEAHPQLEEIVKCPA